MATSPGQREKITLPNFMKWFRIILCLLVITAAILFFVLSEVPRGIKDSPVSPTGTKVNGKQWIFIIGIDLYQKWPRLNTAVNDAKSVKDILLERYCYDQKYFIELYNEKATRKNILKKFRYLAKKLNNDDSLLIYYAGHGHMDSVTKAGSWIPVESGVDESSAWITNHDIKNYLRFDVIKAKHILLVSDSCFSGDFFQGNSDKLPKVTNTAIKKAWQLTSRQAVTSGSIKPFINAEFGKNSVFSHLFFKALKENRKLFLVPSDFFPDIKAGVIENADQVPQLGTLEYNGGRQGGEYVFFLKQDSSADVTEINTEIAKHERELAELDTKIATIKNQMRPMMEQKEAHQKQINELKRKKEAEQAKRRAEIARLKGEKLAKKRKSLIEDIRKYKKIVSSPLGKDMKQSAWKNLIAKYPEGKDVAVGDTIELRLSLNFEIARDERFIAYKNCTVFDTKTGLMWAAKDNGENITWKNAKKYCKKYRSGGYTDWRMPTYDELAGIYDENTEDQHGNHITNLILISGSIQWTSISYRQQATYFDYSSGYSRLWYQSSSAQMRVLPVRSSK